MRKVKVLFFAADPLSISRNDPRLQLDEEVRQIRKRVGDAVFGNMLDFDWKLAARTRDLQQALEDTRPEIVHFSGHGGSRGLVITGADGRTPRRVDTALIRELFETDSGGIRLVVLTACHSLPQAEAIREVVGCAIGAREEISDEASIAFNAKFYSAIASGRSVADAFKRARMALSLDFPAERDILQLLHRKDVDPAKLVFVSRFRRFARVGAAAAAAVVLSAAVALAIIDPPNSNPAPGAVRLGDCTSDGAAPSNAPSMRTLVGTSAEPESPLEAEANLARALSFCRAGNHDSAFAYFKRAADGGDPEAMSFLGIAYVSGEGTDPDTTLGRHWLHRAASKERNPRGMNALAIMYENDETMAQGRSWAMHWYGEAADRGYAEAMRNLGRLHRTEPGTPRNDSMALDWFRKAVLAGSRDALVDMGRMHEQGISGRRDVSEAFRLYSGAAAAGSSLGMYAMGRVYRDGVGVPRDYAEARTWFLRAACAGSPEAMNDLGLIFEQGLGAPADRGEAIGWYRRAADGGSRVAATNLARLERRGFGRMIPWIARAETGPPPACAAPTPPAAFRLSTF